MSTDSLYRTAALVKYNVILRLRDPAQLVSYLVTPMIFMVLFKPLYTKALGGGLVQTVTGQLVMFSVFAMAIVGNAIFVEREWRTWDRLRASRATRAELLIGKALPVFAVLMFQQTVLVVYGCLVVGMPVPRSIGLLALAMAVWGFTLMTMGSALATLVRSRGDLMMASDVGSIAISSIGGALLPVSLMPGWAQAVAPFSPGYWGLGMIRSAVEGRTADTLRPALVCLGIALVAGTFASYRLARGWGRSRLV
ncbi:ABC transporter permease [Streptomyces sp. SL13]|uniref:Transport permease protein n=1 Tax=Streptantibioticus silvisoli TaxID=2705255 RepID=A0AA90K290_9ACTN|nr:ABC transporter permease [Streptantibioticus silvisoli]MDI5964559.1 ABC transporter permease [Streptantibioticus silvisoli]MDI5974471.1 ABC transporter permease [Streptantibioticus silvisoli]